MRCVSAGELFQAYDANEAAAQQQYGDKPLLVTGTVDSVALDFSDKPFVTLKTDNMFMSAHANFVDEDQPKLSGLAKGQEITMLCMDGASEVAGTPMLNGCRLR